MFHTAPRRGPQPGPARGARLTASMTHTHRSSEAFLAGSSLPGGRAVGDGGGDGTWQPTAGRRAWSHVYACNVDVLRVYRRTATVSVACAGLRDGEWMTVRGHRLDRLAPPRRLTGVVDGGLVYAEQEAT